MPVLFATRPRRIPGLTKRLTLQPMFLNIRCTVLGVLLSTAFTVPLFAQSYPSVQIGDQVWMTRNLDVVRFRNGDPIPQANSLYEWNRAYETRRPAYCFEERPGGQMGPSGILYNWWAVVDPRGLAPAGWHVPSSAEWALLAETLGGSSVAGKLLRETAGWRPNRNDPTRYTNAYGFSALPTGIREGRSGRYLEQGVIACWWTCNRGYDPYVWGITIGGPSLERFSYPAATGVPVRCVQGELPPQTEPED